MPRQVQQSFSANDDIVNISDEVIYYRLKVIGKDGTIKYSNVDIIRKTQIKNLVTVHPNPTAINAYVKFYVEKPSEVDMQLIDKPGQMVLTQKEKTVTGYNTIILRDLNRYCHAVYIIELFINDKTIT